jgi:hypothetical protein
LFISLGLHTNKLQTIQIIITTKRETARPQQQRASKTAAHLRGRKRTVTMMFSLALGASTAATEGALPAAREETDEGVVGRAEAVEEGVVGRAEVGVAGRAKAAEGVVGRPPEEDDGVVGRAEEEDGADPRPPDEVLAGGGAAAAAAAGERRDRNGEMLERVDLDDDDIAGELRSDQGTLGLGVRVLVGSRRARGGR